MLESLLTGAVIVLTFTVLVKGVEEWRAERRWWRRYKSKHRQR